MIMSIIGIYARRCIQFSLFFSLFLFPFSFSSAQTAESNAKKVSEASIQGVIGFKRADGSEFQVFLEKLNIDFETGKVVSGSVEVHEAIKFTLPLAGEVTINKKPGQEGPVVLIDKNGFTLQGTAASAQGLFTVEFNALVFDINLLKETQPVILSGNVQIKPSEPSVVLLSAVKDGSINWKIASAAKTADVTNLLEMRFAIKEIIIDSKGVHLPKDAAIKAFMDNAMIENITFEADDAFVLSPSFHDGKLKVTNGSARFVKSRTDFAVYDKEGLRLTKDAALAALPDELLLPKKETAYLKFRDEGKLLVRVEKSDGGTYIWTEDENAVKLYLPVLGIKEPVKISIPEEKKLFVKTTADNRLELVEGVIKVSQGLQTVKHSFPESNAALEIVPDKLVIAKEKEKPLTLEMTDAELKLSTVLLKDAEGKPLQLQYKLPLTIRHDGSFTGSLEGMKLDNTKLDVASLLRLHVEGIKDIKIKSGQENQKDTLAVTVTLLGPQMKNLEVDLASGEVVGGEAVVEDTEMHFPVLGAVKVPKAKLNPRGLHLASGGNPVDGKRIDIYNFSLKVNLLHPGDTEVTNGNLYILYTDPYFLQVLQEYEGGPLSYAVRKSAKAPEESFVDVRLKRTAENSPFVLRLDGKGLTITNYAKADLSYRFGEFKFENASVKLSNDFAINIFNMEKSAASSDEKGTQTVVTRSQFLPKIKNGSAGFLSKNASVASLDKEGFKFDTTSILIAKLPAEIPLPSKEVMFLVIKDIKDKAEKLFVKCKAIDENTLKMWSDIPVTLALPALSTKGKQMTLSVSIPESNAILFNVKDFKVTGGSLSAAPSSPLSFDYENIPFKLGRVTYDIESQQPKIDGSFEIVFGEGASAKNASFNFTGFSVSQYGLSGEVDISSQSMPSSVELSQVQFGLTGGKIVFHAGEVDAKATNDELVKQLAEQKKTVQTEQEMLERDEKEYKGKLAEKPDTIQPIEQKLQEIKNSMEELEKEKLSYKEALQQATSTLEEKIALLRKTKEEMDVTRSDIKKYDKEIKNYKTLKAKAEDALQWEKKFLQEYIEKNWNAANVKTGIDKLSAEIAGHESSIQAAQTQINKANESLAIHKESLAKLEEEIAVPNEKMKELRDKISEVSKKIDAAAVETLALKSALSEERNKPAALQSELAQKALDSISAGIASLKDEIKAIDAKIQEITAVSQSEGKSVMKQISISELTGKVHSLPMGGTLSSPVEFEGLSGTIDKGKVMLSGSFSIGGTPEAQTWYHRRKDALFARSEVVLGVFADGGNEPPVATMSLWGRKLSLPLYYVSMLFRDNQLRLANFDAGVKYKLNGDVLETTIHLGLAGKDILYGKAVVADKKELLTWNNLDLDFDKGNIEAAVSLSDAANTQVLFYDLDGRVNKLGGMPLDADRVSFAFHITEKGLSGTVSSSLSQSGVKPLFTAEGMDGKASFNLNAVSLVYENDKETSSNTLGGMSWKMGSKEYPLQISALTFKDGKLTGDIKGLSALPAITLRPGTEFRLNEGKIRLTTTGEIALTELKGGFITIASIALKTPAAFSNCSLTAQGFTCQTKSPLDFNWKADLTSGISSMSAAVVLNEVDLKIENSKILRSTCKGTVTVTREKDSFTSDVSLKLWSEGGKDKLEGTAAISFSPAFSKQSYDNVSYTIDKAELSVAFIVDKTANLSGGAELTNVQGSLTQIPAGAFSPAIAFSELSDFALTETGLSGRKEFSSPFKTTAKLQDYDPKRGGTPVELSMTKLEMYGRSYRVVGEMILTRNNLPPGLMETVDKNCSVAKAPVDFTANTSDTLIAPGNKEITFLFCKGELTETEIKLLPSMGFKNPNLPTLFVRFPDVKQAFLEISGPDAVKGFKESGGKASFTGNQVKATLHLPFLGNAGFTKEEEIQNWLSKNGNTYPMIPVTLGSFTTECSRWDKKANVAMECSVKSVSGASVSTVKQYTVSDFVLDISKIALVFNGPSSVSECSLQNAPFLQLEGSVKVAVLSASTPFNALYVDKNGVCGSFTAKNLPKSSVGGNDINVTSAKITFKGKSARMDVLSGEIGITLDGKTVVSAPFPKWDISFPGSAKKDSYIASSKDFYFGTLADKTFALEVKGSSSIGTGYIKSVSVQKLWLNLSQSGQSAKFIGVGETAMKNLKVGGTGDGTAEGEISFESAQGKWTYKVKLTKYPELKNLEITIGSIAKVTAESAVVETDDKKVTYMRLKNAKMTLLVQKMTADSDTYNVGDRIKVYSDKVEVDNSLGPLPVGSKNKILLIGSTSVNSFDFGKDTKKGEYFTLTGNFKAQFAGMVEFSGGIDKLHTYKMFADGTDSIGSFFLTGVGPQFLISGSFSWVDLDNNEEIPIYKIDKTICPSTTLDKTTVKDTDDKTDITADVDIHIGKGTKTLFDLYGRVVILPGSKTFGLFVELDSGIEVPLVVTPTLPPVPVVTLKGVTGGFLISSQGVYSGTVGGIVGIAGLDTVVFPAWVIFTYKEDKVNKTTAYMATLCGGFKFNLPWDQINPMCYGGVALDLIITEGSDADGFKGTAKAVCKFPPSTGFLLDASADLTLCLVGGDECKQNASDYGELKDCVAGGNPPTIAQRLNLTKALSSGAVKDKQNELDEYVKSNIKEMANLQKDWETWENKLKKQQDKVMEKGTKLFSAKFALKPLERMYELYSKYKGEKVLFVKIYDGQKMSYVVARKKESLEDYKTKMKESAEALQKAKDDAAKGKDSDLYKKKLEEVKEKVTEKEKELARAKENLELGRVELELKDMAMLAAKAAVKAAEEYLNKAIDAVKNFANKIFGWLDKLLGRDKENKEKEEKAKKAEAEKQNEVTKKTEEQKKAEEEQKKADEKKKFLEGKVTEKENALADAKKELDAVKNLKAEDLKAEFDKEIKKKQNVLDVETSIATALEAELKEIEDFFSGEDFFSEDKIAEAYEEILNIIKTVGATMKGYTEDAFSKITKDPQKYEKFRKDVQITKDAYVKDFSKFKDALLTDANLKSINTVREEQEKEVKKAEAELESEKKSLANISKEAKDMDQKLQSIFAEINKREKAVEEEKEKVKMEVAPETTSAMPDKIRYYVSFNADAKFLKDVSFLTQNIKIKGRIDEYGLHLYGHYDFKLDVDLKAVVAKANLDISCLLCKLGKSDMWGQVTGVGKARVEVIGLGIGLNLISGLGFETSPKFRFSGLIAGGGCVGSGCKDEVCDSCIDDCCPNNPCKMLSTACGKRDSCIDGSLWDWRAVGSGCADFTLP